MQKLPFALIGIAVIVLAVFLYIELQSTPAETGDRTYTSAIYGISFDYPEGYVLSEPTQDTVTLVREEESVPPENGEGPTGITIQVFDTPSENQSLSAWVVGNPSSNLALGDGIYVSTTVDGVDAVRYSWSGLYEGETTAFLHGGRVILVSVTRLSLDDHTTAYEKVLDSLTLSSPSMQ
jgi:hypothetical protein